MSLTFRFLGTASGLPEIDRFGQTTVLTSERSGAAPEHFLLDAGDGAASLLRRHNYDFLAIKGIAISHMHGDHHGGLVQVVKTMMHMNREEDLTIFAPTEGIEGLSQYLTLSYLFDEMLGYRINWIPLSPDNSNPVPILENMQLAAHPNDHLRWTRERLHGRTDLPRPFTYESYSFVLEHPEHRIIFSGNLDGPRGADEIAGIYDPCDLLIMELAHVHPTHLAELLAKHDVRAVALSHFHPKWNDVSPEEILGLMREGSASFVDRVPVFITRDGDVVEVRHHSTVNR